MNARQEPVNANQLLQSQAGIILRANTIEYSIDGYNKEGNHMYSTIYVEEGFTKTKKVIASLKLSERAAPEN